MPAGVDASPGTPTSVAMLTAAAGHLPDWLGREPDITPTGIAAADALRGRLGA
jgi:hypothetical protein